MASSLWITGFALLVMETFAGMVANGFIVLINCIDWFRSRKLSPTDLILICLGLSRLMWHTLAMLQGVMIFIFWNIYTLNHKNVKLPLLWFITDSINLWFATWLSALYLLKIATFSHPIFLQVKQKFSGLVPWLLLSSVVFSVFMTIVITESNSGLALCDPYKVLLNNSCDSDIETPRSCRQFIIAVTAPNFLPLVIFLSSKILLIISLWKHIRHLQNNGIRVRDLNTNVHLNALKVLVSFAILYLSSFVAMTLKMMLISVKLNYIWAAVLCDNVSAVCPSVHGVILILINPKLRQAWVRMIQHLKRLLRKNPS